MSKNNIQILGAANTGVKGKQCIEAHMNYTILSTGVSNTETAKHGVSFIIEPTMAKKKHSRNTTDIRKDNHTKARKRLDKNYIYIIICPMQQ